MRVGDALRRLDDKVLLKMDPLASDGGEAAAAWPRQAEGVVPLVAVAGQTAAAVLLARAADVPSSRLLSLAAFVPALAAMLVGSYLAHHAERRDGRSSWRRAVAYLVAFAVSWPITALALVLVGTVGFHCC